MSQDATLESVVLRAFAPIVTTYGYRLIESDDSYARLESAGASIHVYYDRHRSLEVGLGFGELVNGRSTRRIPFSLGEVYRQCGVPDAEKRTFFQSADVHSIESFLVCAAERLLKYCGSILAGDRRTLDAMQKRRSAESAAYTRQAHLESVRGEADDAWRNKRYQEFITLLGGFKDILPESDQRKLDYAEKKLTDL